MRIDSFFYRFGFRFGSPGWDSAEPQPELTQLVDGRRPGRALDLGCGTGANAIYLGRQGWDVIGVDFVPEAVATAKERALKALCQARFIVGDVTHLRQVGISGPFDLLVDIGCYHAIPGGLRDAYRPRSPP
jgi:methylase of polypeptide subunit release factors